MSSSQSPGGGGRIALATDCKGLELKDYLSLLKVDDLSVRLPAATMSNTAIRTRALSRWRSKSWDFPHSRP